MGLTYRRMQPSAAAQIETPPGYQFAIWNDYQTRSKDHSYEHILVYEDNSNEVARVELDNSLSAHALRESTYPVGEIQTPIVEIQFLDVRSPYRLQGIGSQIVEFLESAFPSSTLAALSEKADGFWESRGWLQVDPHDRMRRTLFLRAPKS